MCKTTEAGNPEAGITVTIVISQEEIAEAQKLGDPNEVMEAIEDLLGEALELALTNIAVTLGIEEAPEDATPGVCPICGRTADHEPGG